jgi:hypothetical protein
MVYNGIKGYMGLNIKDPQIEELITEVAKVMGVSKMEVIRQSVLDRAQLLGVTKPKRDPEEFRKFLEDMWKKHPSILELRVTKEEYDALYE